MIGYSQIRGPMARVQNNRWGLKTTLLISVGGGILSFLLAVFCLLVATSTNYWAILSTRSKLLVVAGAFVLGFIGVFEWVFMMYAQDRRD